MAYTEHQILLFFLILVRMTSLFLAAPVFSSRSVPMMFKIGMGGLISFLIFPVVEPNTPEIALDWLQVLVVVFAEIFTGVMIGFVLSFLFVGIEIAGEYIGLDMGFSMVQEIDPTFNQPLSVIARLKTNMAMLIFLLLDGHHYLIEALAYSYRTVPVGGWQLSSLAVQRIMQISAEVFVIGIKIAAPAVVTLFLTSVAMGIIARAVPQMNIFFVGIPLRMLAGFSALIFGMPLFLYVFQKLLEQFENNITYILQVM